MGIGDKITDAFYGRSEKARTRKADKTRAKYSNYPGMTSELLEVLAASNELEAEQQVQLFLGACQGTGAPLQVVLGTSLKPARMYATLLFSDGIKLRFQDVSIGDSSKNPIGGADLPLWGMHSVKFVRDEGPDRLIISGADGQQPYLVEAHGLDPQVMENFARKTNELIAQQAQRQVHQQAAPQPDLNLNFAPEMPLEERLQAWREMEQLSGRQPTPGAEQAIREQHQREKGQ